MVASVLLVLACGTTPTPADPTDPDSADPDSGHSGDTVDSGADTADTADTGDTGDTGPDPSTLDADGDGYRPIDGDCDDSLPHVYPGAPDYCDGLDQDCDGEPIPDGSCGEVGDATAMWSWAVQGEEGHKGGATGALGDVDGDGAQDVGLYTWPDGDWAGGVLAGGDMAALPAQGAFPALAWSADFPVWPGATAYPAGDVDGDGFDDVWSACDSSGGYVGGAFLFLGDADGFGNAEVRQDLLADAWWTDQLAIEFYHLQTGGDVTADGRSDAVSLLVSDTSPYLAIISGSRPMSGHAEFDTLPLVQADTDLNLIDAYLQADLDGDGFDEWVAIGGGEFGEWDTMTVVEGEDLVDGAAVSTVGHVSWYEDSGETYLTTRSTDSAPDIDGDGLNDLAVRVLATDDRVALLSGGIPDGSLAPSIHVSIEDPAGDVLQPLLWTDDTDGDDVPDFVASYSLVPSTVLATGGALELDAIPHVRLSWEGGVIAKALTDMTGDGHPEWVLNHMYWYPEGSAYYYNRVLIIEGFDIPWDDPSKW